MAANMRYDYHTGSHLQLVPHAPHGAFFIVGGGASLIGFPWQQLYDKRVIATNNAYQTCPNAEIVLFTDKRFWSTHRNKLLEHSGTIMTTARSLASKRIQTLKITGTRGLDTHAGCVRSGNSTGYKAINLAVNLGAKSLFLLGFDMRRLNGRSHWHDGESTDRNLENMLRYFGSLVRPLSELGVHVINCSPESAIPFWDKCHWSACLESCTTAA